MFVGHYAAAFALKGKEKGASLGMLFIATQFVDILFFPFAMMGIEKLRFVEGFTAVNNFDMYFYPYTHGLVGSLFWAVLFYVLYYFFVANGKTNRKGIAIVMALGVLSHWFTDLIVHSPDLPILSGDPKLGFGLWNNKWLTYLVEAALVIVGWLYYQKKTKAITMRGKYIGGIFVFFLLGLNYLNLFVLPANEDIASLTISALVFYFLLAGVAFWVDRQRA